MRIHRKLMIVYFLMNLVITTILSTIFITTNEKMSTRNMSQFYDSVLSQQINNIRYKQQIYENLAVQFVLSPIIQELLESDPSVLVEKNIFTIHTEIERLIGHLYALREPGIHSIRLFHRSEKVPSDGRFIFPMSRLSSVYSDKEMNVSEPSWKVMRDPITDYRYLSFLQPIYSTKSFDKIGYVQIIVEPSSFINTDASGQETTELGRENTNSFIINQEGIIVLHPDAESMGNHVDPVLSMLIEDQDPTDESTKNTYYMMDDEEYLVLWKPIPSLKWNNVALVPKQMAFGSIDQFRTSLIITLFICTAFFFFVSYLITKRMMKGLKLLHKKVLNLGRGKELYSPVSGNTGFDEISVLDRSFDSMIENLGNLINENYIVKLNKREMELKFLQNQINSHFLYNTLDSIKNEIDLDERETAVKMITALADLFRISVSQGKELILWEDEIYHARCYLEIIKHRFGYSYEMDWQINQDIYSIYTPKVILQPILENAIFHGLVPKKARGMIQIEGFIVEQAVEIRIRDNGIGMPQAVIDEILNGTGENQGVGLSNVQNRIKLYVGEGYGIHIESKEDIGTIVSIRLPILHQEEIKHVSVANS